MAEHWWICFFVYLFTDRCMQSWNADFFLAISYWGGKKISGSVSGSKFNWCRSGRVGSDDLGYGPGSGFTLKPVQTSNLYTPDLRKLLEIASSEGHSYFKVVVLFFNSVISYTIVKVKYYPLKK